MKQRRLLGSTILACLIYVFSIYLMSMATLSGNVIVALVMMYSGFLLVLFGARTVNPMHYKRMTYRAEHEIVPKPINVPKAIVPYLTLGKFLCTFMCIRMMCGYRLSEELLPYREGAWIFSLPGMFARHLVTIGVVEADSGYMQSLFWTDMMFVCGLLLLFCMHYIDVRCSICRLYDVYKNLKPLMSEGKKNETTTEQNTSGGENAAEHTA